MSQMFQSPVSQTILAGEVCLFRFHIRVTNSQDDEKVFPIFREYRALLREEVERLVKKHMGDQFEIRRFDIEPGSVEIILVVGTAYVVISRYKNFIESINLFLSQLKSFFSNFAASHSSAPVEVTGSWSPGSALASAELAIPRPDYNYVLLILLLYLVLSHAAILSVIIYQLLKK